MARVYATEADLIAYGAPPGVTLPTGAEATRKLTRASEHVDEMLLTAIYDTDTNGMPTKASVIQALENATCAQVVWWAGGGGDETGTQGKYKDIALGSLRLSRGSSGAGEVERYAPDALRHLRLEGLLPGGVSHYQRWEGNF